MRAQKHTSWDELETTINDLGQTGGSFVLGDIDDETAPRIGRYYFPPSVRVAPHLHDVDYAEIILEGAQRIGGRWYRAGDIRIVRAGTVYGPLIAGPDGVTVTIVFRSAQPGAISPRRDGARVVIDLAP
jgi:hypothetical protein